jgi:hypothetical protein
MSKSAVAAMNKRVPELMGLNEVAEELGVATNNVRTVRDLPAPIPQDLKRGDLWRADVVRDFAADRRKNLTARGQAKRRTKE